MNLITSNPDFDLLEINLSNSFGGYVATKLHVDRFLNMDNPAINSDPLFTYQIAKQSFELFDPKDCDQVNLLQVNTLAESLVIQAVYQSLPDAKRTRKNLDALGQCCYYKPGDFANIAMRHNSPMVVVPIQDLFLRMNSSSTDLWEHLL
ncbi:hypothetical protein Lepto7375DRAFT_7219 [Leptolyngbya sp. PCC 7375]|nr:hypothetical protein Lepto7375DRAFT_7219 [Leptolyngbya sp. PCC 7375]